MTTPPQEPHQDPNLRSGDHEPTVDFTKPESTKPLEPEAPPATPPPPASGVPPTAPPPSGAYPPYGAPQYAAPYGIDPKSGRPYSDKSKLIAGLLQLLLPLGIGRMYTGHVSLGVIQLVVVVLTCGLGSLWPFIDGILMLVGDPTDAEGRPLRS